MKSKSVAGFILGLISGIAFGIESFYILAVFLLAGAIAEAGGGSGTIFTIISWACVIGSILAIIGASFCFNKSKVGGILMLFAFLMLCILPVYAFINSSELTGLLILWIAPLICLFIGIICALSAKKKPQISTNSQPSNVNNSSVINSANPNYCQYCGAKLNGAYCSNCGAKRK